MEERPDNSTNESLSDNERGGNRSLQNRRTSNGEQGISRRHITLQRILGGDILQGDWVRRNVGLIILIVVLALLYVGNGYVSQQEAIEIATLKKQVDSARNIALIRSCELLERSRQSYIEEYLKEKGDSTLQISTIPPYIIKIDTAK